MLLSGLAGNFEHDDEKDACILNLLATFEEMLEQNGVIESDFAVIVCKPK